MRGPSSWGSGRRDTEQYRLFMRTPHGTDSPSFQLAQFQPLQQMRTESLFLFDRPSPEINAPTNFGVLLESTQRPRRSTNTVVSYATLLSIQKSLSMKH